MSDGPEEITFFIAEMAIPKTAGRNKYLNEYERNQERSRLQKSQTSVATRARTVPIPLAAGEGSKLRRSEMIMLFVESKGKDIMDYQFAYAKRLLKGEQGVSACLDRPPVSAAAH